MRVEYNSNNSGGEWWLKDEDWLALEAAGWKVDWCRDDVSPGIRDERFLGALATSATREGLSLEEAVAEWERVTGEFSEETGCPCCGQPHNFSLYDDDGEYLGGSEA
jgi:hypothetical protein